MTGIVYADGRRNAVSIPASQAKPRHSRKPRKKVIAAGLTALAGAVIVFVADRLGVDGIDPDIAYGMAAAALLAAGGGYQKTED